VIPKRLPKGVQVRDVDGCTCTSKEGECDVVEKVQTSPIAFSLEMNMTESRKSMKKLETILKEIGWYCTQEQESASEAIAKDCSCRRWMMVELVLEAAMAPKVDVSSMDVPLKNQGLQTTSKGG
jgi:predicted nucleic acid-binding Zn ribbon protein